MRRAAFQLQNVGRDSQQRAAGARQNDARSFKWRPQMANTFSCWSVGTRRVTSCRRGAARTARAKCGNFGLTVVRFGRGLTPRRGKMNQELHVTDPGQSLRESLWSPPSMVLARSAHQSDFSARLHLTNSTSRFDYHCGRHEKHDCQRGSGG